MRHLVFLPATEPGDPTYGTILERVEAFPDATVHPIVYPRLVWYNADVRREAIAQIRALGLAPVTLVGFSKSGLGAWNIARSIPEIVGATIIFDAPVARTELPPWGTAPFYDGDEAWWRDQPINTIAEFRVAMPPTHRLVLVSGEGFHDEMVAFARALDAAGVTHAFLPRPRMKHHWRSGWLEDALEVLADGMSDAGR